MSETRATTSDKSAGIPKTHLQLSGLACANCHVEVARPGDPPTITSSGIPIPPVTALKACSRCKSVVYCSAACQKRDYSEHKAVCRALPPTIAAEEVLLGTSAILPRPAVPSAALIRARLAGLRSELRGIISDADTRLALHRPSCAQCGIPRGGLPGARYAPIRCPTCRLVECCSAACWDACSTKHEGSHACRAWQALAVQELFLHTVFFRFGETAVEPHVPDAICEVYTPPLPWGWPSYIAARALPVAEMHPAHVEFTQDALSKPLTMLFALSQLMSSDALGSLRSLTVHVVGAGAWDMSHGTMDALEELLHVLPQLQHLRVAFVGPALPAVPGAESSPDAATGGAGAGVGAAAGGAGPAPPRWSSLRMESCDACSARRRVCDVVLARCRYEDFLSALEEAHGAAAFAEPMTLEESLGDAAAVGHRSPPLGRPDLVVAFNAGFAADEAQWSPALQRVLTAGWPLAFTSDHDACSAPDLAAVQRIAVASSAGSAAVLLPPSPCPFASPIVRVDPLPDDPRLTRGDSEDAAKSAAPAAAGTAAAPLGGDAVYLPNSFISIVQAGKTE